MMVVNRALLVEFFYYSSVSCTRKIKIVIESLILRSYKLEKVLLVGLLFLGILLSLGSVVSIRTTLQVWTLKDDKVYAITYVAEEDDYENDLQIAQRIIESFAIIS